MATYAWVNRHIDELKKENQSLKDKITSLEQRIFNLESMFHERKERKNDEKF
jgi:hypothetical protein